MLRVLTMEVRQAITNSESRAPGELVVVRADADSWYVGCVVMDDNSVVTLFQFLQAAKEVSFTTKGWHREENKINNSSRVD